MGEWISVKDRLPSENGLYLTFCNSQPEILLNNFDRGVGKFGVWWNYAPSGDLVMRYRFIEAEDVTHWMPLPDPPKV